MANKAGNSTGHGGEMAAEWWFKNNKWHMDRHQPACRRIQRMIGKMFVTTIIEIDEGGDADYMGFKYLNLNGHEYPIYVVCEVKECKEGSMPCSRMKPKQHKWFEMQPEESRYVGIFWTAHRRFEVYPYKAKGSYKFGVDKPI